MGKKRLKIIIIVGAFQLFACNTDSPSSTSQLSRSTPQYFAARGILQSAPYRAQENTVDAIMAIARWNQDHPSNPISGCEVSLIVTEPQNGSSAIVLAHDEDAQDLTGENINLRTSTQEAIQKLNIKRVLGEIAYDQSRPFSFLNDLLDAATKNGPPPFILWLTPKHPLYPIINASNLRLSKEPEILIKALLDLREVYRKERNIDVFESIIMSSTNPFLVRDLIKEAEKAHLTQQELAIFFDYSDLGFGAAGLAHVGSELDKNRPNEVAFNLPPSRWVTIQDSLMTESRLKKFHDAGQKIIGYGQISDNFKGIVDFILSDY